MSTLEEFTNVDLNLIATIGSEFARKFSKLKIFIQGVRGLGAEIAKNLIMMGPQELVIHDDCIVRINDLGSNFFLTQEQVAKISRSESSIQQLSELRPSVKTEILRGEISEESLQKFDMVVFTDFYNKEELVKFNEFCRKNKKGFIYTGSLGLFGFCFIDFGDQHIIIDPTGQDLRGFQINSIKNNSTGDVKVHTWYDRKFDMKDGESIKLIDVENMQELNGKIFKIKNANYESFNLGDMTKFDKQAKSGFALEVKIPEVINFKSLKVSLTEISNKLNQNSNGNKRLIDHILILSFLEFHQKNGHLPKTNEEEDSTIFTKIFQEIYNNYSDQKVCLNQISDFAKFSTQNISPNCSFWGGLVSQEILKYTGILQPVQSQWIIFDFMSTLPNSSEQIDRNPLNSRYDDQIAIYGREIQEQIFQQNSFIVGAGSQGCEILKMFALMGVSTQNNLLVIDDSQIIIPDLGNCLFYQEEHKDLPKAQVSSIRANEINPSFQPEFKVAQMYQYVNSINADEFWDQIDFSINATRNIETQMYMNEKTISHGQTFFDCKNSGSNGALQILLPNSDNVDRNPISYGFEQRMVNSRSFLYLLTDCLHWSKDSLIKLLDKLKIMAKYFIDPRQCHLEINDSKLSGYDQNRLRERIINIQQKFQNPDDLREFLCSQTINYISKFEPKFLDDSKDVNLSQNQQQYKALFQAIYYMHLQLFSLPIIEDEIDLKFEKIYQFENPFELKQAFDQPLNFQFQGDILINKSIYNKDDPCDELKAASADIFKLCARIFKVDEINPIDAAVQVLKLKQILICTTSLLAGCAGIELLQKLSNPKFQDFNNFFFNQNNTIQLLPLKEAEKSFDKEYDPIFMAQKKAVIPGSTMWDQILINGPLTIQQLNSLIEQKYKFRVENISINSEIFFSVFGKINLNGEQLIEQASKQPQPFNKQYLFLKIDGSDLESGQISYEIPVIKYIMQK